MSTDKPSSRPCLFSPRSAIGLLGGLICLILAVGRGPATDGEGTPSPSATPAPAVAPASNPARGPARRTTALAEPSQPPVGLPGERFDTTPPRRTTGLDLTKNGWTYDCMECHRTFETGWDAKQERVEHAHIRMDHGLNSYCANCHHPTNKNAFANYDGSEIAEKDVVLLCAKCHGPIYRDWEARVHGRINGYWRDDLGPQTRLRCIQCHDPHAPDFAPMEPKAGPAHVGAMPREFLITSKPGVRPIPQGKRAEPAHTRHEETRHD